MTIEIGLSSWSLHRNMGPGPWGRKDYPENTKLVDFPAFAKKEYGCIHLEMVDSNFPAKDPAYIKKLQSAITRSGSVIENVAIDCRHLGDADPALRAQALAEIDEWIDVAGVIGSKAVRCGTGPGMDMTLAIEGFRHMLARAERYGMLVLIENHDGVTTDPDLIVDIVKEIDNGNFGVLPDFGNFSMDIAYDALEKVMPYAKLIHAKTIDFKEDGEDATIDYKQCMDIVKGSGFIGVLSVEFDGSGDQYEGIRKTIDLINKYK